MCEITKKSITKDKNKNTTIVRLSFEIKNSLSQINKIACYYQSDEKIQNNICSELRKINKRIDKIVELNS